MSKPDYKPTLEQIALAEEKRAKRAKLAATIPAAPKAIVVDAVKGHILPRKWIELPTTEGSKESMRVKIMTWNLLAQILVRRELFPTSDCLKASQREHMIYNEILTHKADIACMQEVDRLEKLLPVLNEAGYDHAYASGPQKKHGCLIAFAREKFEKVAEKTVYYDNEEIRSEGDEQCRIGSSFRTKNIGFMVALRGIGSATSAAGRGVIVATTHLFWHPRYTYERARQAGILVREVYKFRKTIGHEDWPCIISGDFNFGPDDPGYSLLVGDPLLAAQEDRMAPSRVVHRSLDPSIPPTSVKVPGDEEEGGGGEESKSDKLKVITNARPARPSDGLMSPSELAMLFANPVHSAYEEGLTKLRRSSANVPTYGDNVAIHPARRGVNEPEWTSYTHFWQAVLDYIFVLDPNGGHSSVVGFAEPHRTKDLQPGLPRQGVCGSDHVSLCAEIVLENRQN